jgi:streptomycin 6-kinase
LRYTNDPKPEVLSHISVWGLTFEKYTREYTEFVIPLTHVERADRIYKHLVRTSPRETVLHGDLHHNNILRAGAGDTWVAIDPKGVWGDPCFEVGAFMRNPYPQAAEWPQLPETLFKRIQLFSDELGFDMERVWGWSYAQSVMAAIWSVRDREDWRAWLKITEALGSLEDQL